ncbi:MAG: pyruvate kinase [Clostridia bacterium]|nr:pyruvate kinase [Clostridia bacterium]
MRKTKIICTIGPASLNEQILTDMCKAGMNVARMNFSHGDHAEQLAKITLVKKVREALNMPIAIMLDTKGPEYRIKTFGCEKIFLNDGDDFTFTTDDIIGDNTRVSVTYENLHEDLKPGDRVLLCNGLLIFEVREVSGRDIRCKVIAGGELSDRKSMSFPNKVLNQAYLSEQDKADILVGIEHDVDFIACSFVSTRQDLIDVKNFLSKHNADHISLIAKIENQPGIDNIEEICQECEGIMIGRGDMGVEIPYEELPAVQKKLITKCRLLGKRVITATEMLESMIKNPRPTRAEISDVANAVYDGSSAIMLSGETAAGKYPVEAVTAMARIAEHTEQNINYTKRFHTTEVNIDRIIDGISHSACGLAIDLNASALVVSSISGRTARMVSRFRPPMPIIGMTTDERTWRHLALNWGVHPMLCEEYPSSEVLFYVAKRMVCDELNLKAGDRLVMTGGVTTGASGKTDLIKVEII